MPGRGTPLGDASEVDEAASWEEVDSQLAADDDCDGDDLPAFETHHRRAEAATGRAARKRARLPYGCWPLVL